MLIRGGENIYPREIEEYLHGHPAIADVLEKLSGGEDMRTGLIVVFFIMLGVLAACAGV